MLRISKKNSKLGKIANVSTIPVKDCGELAVHCKSACYALKSWRQYPNVRKAWKANSQMFRNKPDQAFEQLGEYLEKAKPDFFRIHVSGDFLNQNHVDGYVDIAVRFPAVRFLAFTKMHKLDYSEAPKNLQIVFSVWSSMSDAEIPNGRPRAWVQDGNETRIPDNAINCPGLCENCGMCWSLSDLNRDVFFEAH